jgi:hypothetical protein
VPWRDETPQIVQDDVALVAHEALTAATDLLVKHEEGSIRSVCGYALMASRSRPASSWRRQASAVSGRDERACGPIGGARDRPPRRARHGQAPGVP